MLAERVAEFVADPRRGAFDELALAAFAFQFERIPAYRRLCAARGAVPGRVGDWREVPPVPAAAFKSLALAAAPAVEVFRSSGTTAGEAARSVHHHPFPDLYRRTLDAAFPRFCLAGVAAGAGPEAGRVPMLSLVPPRAQAPDSSLAFMIDHVLARWGSAESAVACGPRGVEAGRARSWTAARQRDRRPALVLGTSLALRDWLEALGRQDLRFRLPAGSAVFDTGGFKGRRREVAPGELLALVEERLGVPRERVVREYGMTELTSQLYTRALEGGDPDLFVAPHWVRARVLRPATLEEAPAGDPGAVAIFDLANLGSAVHLLTEDLGAAEPGGLRLLGRAAGAELRGCSQQVEELT
jgi:hypothetical protein